MEYARARRMARHASEAHNGKFWKTLYPDVLTQ